MVRRFSLFALCLLFGCGQIPEDTVGSSAATGLNDLVYSDDSWGFQISRPNDTWGISVQTFPLSRDPQNGLPLVDVRVSSPFIGTQGSFRPELQMTPRGMLNGKTLDDLVIEYEEYELKLIFGGYQLVGEKQKVKLEGGEVVLWEFRNARLGQGANYPGTTYSGTRFLAAVAAHNRQSYFFIANGTTDGFPVADYKQIVSSLRFSAK
jgi:hypothetical protein